MAGELRIKMTVTPETTADAGKGFEVTARFTAPSSRILTNTTAPTTASIPTQVTNGEEIPDTAVLVMETAASSSEDAIMMREELQVETSAGGVIETKERGTIDLGTQSGGPNIGIPVGIMKDLLDPVAIISPNFSIAEVFTWLGDDGSSDRIFKIIDLGPGVERELAVVSI